MAPRARLLAPEINPMSSPLLTPTHAFDRAAIMRTAWACARHAVVRNEATPRSRWWMPLTLREAFADALRRQWDLARGHRACELHRIEQAAEAKRIAALPAMERRIVELTEARMLAEPHRQHHRDVRHAVRDRRAPRPARMSPDQAFATWWQAEQPRWGEKTFEDLVPRPGETTQAARDRFGRSVFDALVSGVHMTTEGISGITADARFTPPAFEGTGNLARKVSQERVIHYRDAASWLAHQQQFGASTSVMASVMKTLDQSARQIALMEKLGTNPAANLNMVLRAIQETYRNDTDDIAKFARGIQGIQNVVGRLDGSLNIPANEMWTSFSATTRTMETMGSLGGVGLTHFVSIWPTVTSEMVHHGVPRLQTFTNLTQALLRGKGGAERQALMSNLGAYSSGLARDMFARWQPDDILPGRISSVANTFMKFTGIYYVFDNTQGAIREMLAGRCGRQAETAWKGRSRNGWAPRRTSTTSSACRASSRCWWRNCSTAPATCCPWCATWPGAPSILRPSGTSTMPGWQPSAGCKVSCHARRAIRCRWLTW